MTDYSHQIISEIENGRLFYSTGHGRKLFDKKTMNYVADMVRNAHKFDFSGMINTGQNISSTLIVTGAEAAQHDMLAIPFDKMLFNLGWFDVMGAKQYNCALVWRDMSDNSLRTVPIGRLKDETCWSMGAHGSFVLLGKEEDNCGDITFAEDGVGEDENCKFLSGVLGLLAMLECRQVYLDAEPASEKLNKARAKQGRQPFFSHSVVKIRLGDVVIRSRGDGHSGRASPVFHWRCGHIKTIHATGKKVKCPATVVGDISRGIRTHDYVVVPPKGGGDGKI